ncbi:MAG: hypothetical protein QOF14_5810 [Hyphomicrobiales bacterium]|jgi:hypothetical protein|nr:hypothetical protein [Hyphomicrobiales bacterium]
MEYITVSSTSISAVGYDDASNTLGIRFINGTEYHYFGVPQDVFEGAKSAPSVGRYVDQYVKKAGYAFARVA